MTGRARVFRMVVLALVGLAAVPADPTELHAPEPSVRPAYRAESSAGLGTAPGALSSGPGGPLLPPGAAPTGAPQPPTPGNPEPVPVLLVPGWSDDEDQLAALEERLTAAGWKPEAVFALSFEDPVGSNRDHAGEIEEAVLALKARTGAEEVDVVAHSMGGLATRYFLMNGGDAHVRRVVFLATPHRGTVSAHIAWGEGAREMEPGSTFLMGLLRSPPLPYGVRAITIRTPIDLHVVPQESATLPGVPDLRVCCPTHAGLLDDEETFEVIERFLKGP